MTARRQTLLRLTAGILAVVAWLLAFAAAYWGEDIRRAQLDPKQPFQTYQPPPAPDYAKPEGWYMRGEPDKGVAPADVFFVHSTTFDGGRDWVGPINDPEASQRVIREVLPNYAGPFRNLARVFAPRYRQASLFAYRLTLRDDGRDARRFAYEDVHEAFKRFLARESRGRPIILAGVGQGAQILDRLAREVQADPSVSSRLVAVYLMDEITPEAEFPSAGPLPLCSQRDQARCVVAWRALASGGPDRGQQLSHALVWTSTGDLDNLGEQAVACVNPLTGSVAQPEAAVDLNQGASNATGLTWSRAPEIMPHQVEAACVKGLLEVSTPVSPRLRRNGSWADSLRAPAFNLFYADIEADARARLSAWYGRPLASPIDKSVPVQPSVIHKVR
jgi:hypothetical protein